MSVRIGNKIVAGMPEKAMRGVGDIFTTTDRGVIAGAVEANGGSYNIADYNSGTESLAVKLASGRLLYVSKTEFATQVANTGACGSFGWNGVGDTLYAWTASSIAVTRAADPVSQETYYTASVTPNVGDSLYYNVNSVSSAKIVEVASDYSYIKTDIDQYYYKHVRNASSDIVGTADSTFLVPKIQNRVLVRVKKATSSDSTWYNLYSDGWVEQGGYIPASTATTQINNLIVPMVDANYAIDITTEASTWTGGNNSVFNRTTTGFQLWTSDDSSFNSVPVIWQVSGYASSTAVTPERTMVQLATGATDEALVTCTEVLSDVAALKLTGQIITYAGTTAPSGYLACDGSAVSRTTYANLFAVIGTAYGEGDGSTTFNLPDATDTPAFWGSPDYNAGVDISTAISAANAFTVPSDGFVFASVFGNYMSKTFLNLNSMQLMISAGNSVNTNTGNGFMMPVRTGDVCYLSGSLKATVFMYYPNKQVISKSCVKY